MVSPEGGFNHIICVQLFSRMEDTWHTGDFQYSSHVTGWAGGEQICYRALPLGFKDGKCLERDSGADLTTGM